MQPTGTKGYMLDEVPDRHDNAILPPKQLRHEQAHVEAKTQHFAQVAQEDYATSEAHFLDEVEFGTRVSKEGREVLAEDVLAPLRSGELSAKDAAKRVAAMRADLNKSRADLKDAMEREDAKWSEVGELSPAEYQRALARRSPQLFSDGRGLLTFPIY